MAGVPGQGGRRGPFAKEALDLPPTDLGADPAAAVGPALGAMIKAFGSGPAAYNPRRQRLTAQRYDGTPVADVLIDYSPLKKKSPADNGRGDGQKYRRLLDKAVMASRPSRRARAPTRRAHRAGERFRRSDVA